VRLRGGVESGKQIGRSEILQRTSANSFPTAEFICTGTIYLHTWRIFKVWKTCLRGSKTSIWHEIRVLEQKSTQTEKGPKGALFRKSQIFSFFTTETNGVLYLGNGNAEFFYLDGFGCNQKVVDSVVQKNSTVAERICFRRLLGGAKPSEKSVSERKTSISFYPSKSSGSPKSPGEGKTNKQTNERKRERKERTERGKLGENERDKKWRRKKNNVRKKWLGKI